MTVKAPIVIIAISLLLILSSGVKILASDLAISNTEFQILEDAEGNSSLYFLLTVSWKNAWRNDRNHDAAWLFFKLHRGEQSTHAKVLPAGHGQFETAITKGPNAHFEVPEDRMGIFVRPSKIYRGDISWRLKIALDPVALETIKRPELGKAHGLEMVYVPEGAFTLGDPDPKALVFSSFFQSDANGEPDGLFTIASEGELRVDSTAGSLLYHSQHPMLQGDQSGPVPVAFPKGYGAFYTMKYELKQGQYTQFLNSISTGQTQHRANFGGRDYAENRGAIFMEDGVYMSAAPERPLNYASWDDGMAYADWAGLRPMTELEFTKASRGPSEPVANEFCWGSGSKNEVLRFIDSNGDLVMAGGLDESDLNDANKEVFAASYYWVLDLAGSLWERVVTIGHPVGRAFKGSHGDGELDEYGYATNQDWPSGIRHEGGIGFRGGGFYEFNRNYHEFNPHSPIAYRRFGSWHGWNRTISYGQRFVRSAY